MENSEIIYGKIAREAERILKKSEVHLSIIHLSDMIGHIEIGNEFQEDDYHKVSSIDIKNALNEHPDVFWRLAPGIYGLLEWQYDEWIKRICEILINNENHEIEIQELLNLMLSHTDDSFLKYEVDYSNRKDILEEMKEEIRVIAAAQYLGVDTSKLKNAEFNREKENQSKGLNIIKSLLKIYANLIADKTEPDGSKLIFLRAFKEKEKIVNESILILKQSEDKQLSIADLAIKINDKYGKTSAVYTDLLQKLLSENSTFTIEGEYVKLSEQKNGR